MTEFKTFVRIIIAMVCIYGFADGQSAAPSPQTFIRRQQNQVEQEELDKQLTSKAIISPSSDQRLAPLHSSILQAIFNIPIQAIKAVSGLVQAVAASSSSSSSSSGFSSRREKLKDDVIEAETNRII